MKLLETPEGALFGLLGEKGPIPAPTVFLFGMSAEQALDSDFFEGLRRPLIDRGCIFVSLDLPGHGMDQKEGDRPEVPGTAGAKSALYGWRLRMEKGDPVIPAFIAKVSSVLGYLIREGYTDPEKVVAAGSSRGAFVAAHFAAADKRIKCVVCLCPVTNLPALYEFNGMEHDPIVNSLSALSIAGKLAGRPAWISIGNNDLRVSTDDAIAFARKLVELSGTEEKVADVELYVYPAAGHNCTPRSRELAAAWIGEKLSASDESTNTRGDNLP